MRGAEYREIIANSCRHPDFLELIAASVSMSRSKGDDSVARWSSIIAEGGLFFFLRALGVLRIPNNTLIL
jgi:hypothetical protein